MRMLISSLCILFLTASWATAGTLTKNVYVCKHKNDLKEIATATGAGGTDAGKRVAMQKMIAGKCILSVEDRSASLLESGFEFSKVTLDWGGKPYTGWTLTSHYR